MANDQNDATAKKNMELMQALDDAWNAQDVEVFRARHKPDVIVRWPGKTEPTVGIEDHTQESIDFWKTFPNQKDIAALCVYLASDAGKSISGQVIPIDNDAHQAS
jgi:hypothetical protein